MTMTRKTITIPAAMDEWVKGQIGTGRYGNDSEYFRDLVRKDRDRHAGATELGRMVDAAETRGMSERTPAEIWADAEARVAARDD